MSGLFCNKIGTGRHFHVSGAENSFLVTDFPQKILLRKSRKKLMTFLLFHYIFVYYPPLIQHFLLFNCHFSVPSLTSISKQNLFLTLPERSRYASKLFLQNIHNIFFSSLQKRSRYAILAHTITKKPCSMLYV